MDAEPSCTAPIEVGKMPVAMMLLVRLLDVLTFIFIARVILSWVAPGSRNPAAQLLVQVTDPVLRPLQRFTIIGGLDLSPIVVLMLISAVRRMLF